MNRIVKSHVAGAAFAVAAALALVWATTGAAHADTAPSATFRVTSTVGTVTVAESTPPRTVTVTTITTIVTIDFGEMLRATQLDPSAVSVTVGGVTPEHFSRAVTFNHRYLIVTLVDRRLGTVTPEELQAIRGSAVRVSYMQPEDAGVQRLQYATGFDVASFDVTATPSEQPAFVAPAKPATVTAIIRDNSRPTITTTITVGPVSSERGRSPHPPTLLVSGREVVVR